LAAYLTNHETPKTAGGEASQTTAERLEQAEVQGTALLRAPSGTLEQVHPRKGYGPAILLSRLGSVSQGSDRGGSWHRVAEATFIDLALGQRAVICHRCGATLETYSETCSAPLNKTCPGFNAIEEARAAFYEEQKQ
jgi:hypothetical protein